MFSLRKIAIVPPQGIVCNISDSEINISHDTRVYTATRTRGKIYIAVKAGRHSQTIDFWESDLLHQLMHVLPSSPWKECFSAAGWFLKYMSRWLSDTDLVDWTIWNYGVSVSRYTDGIGIRQDGVTLTFGTHGLYRVCEGPTLGIIKADKSTICLPLKDCFNEWITGKVCTYGSAKYILSESEIIINEGIRLEVINIQDYVIGIMVALMNKYFAPEEGWAPDVEIPE